MPPPRHAWTTAILMAIAAIAGCRTTAPTAAPQPAAIAAPTTTPGTFQLEAEPLDTWNAVGQILVRMDDIGYEGRSQMLGLYSIRYRGEHLMVLTRSLRLSDSIHAMTTEVTAATASGKPLDSAAASDLLARLQRELPAEIVSVRAQQAAERKAKAAKAKAKSKRVKSRKRKP